MMDIEQLKLILETIRSLGETAGYATVAVFATPYVIKLLETITWVIAIIWIIKLAAEAYKAHHTVADPNEIERTKQAEAKTAESRAVTAMMAISQKLKVNISPYCFASDIEKLYDAIEKLKTK